MFNPLRSLALFLCTCATLLAQDTYPIQMDRLPKQGQTFEVVSKFEQTFEGKGVFKGVGIKDSADRVVAITLRITVDQTNAAGKATKATYHIIDYKGTNNFGGIKGKLTNHMIGKKLEAQMVDKRRWYGERLEDGSVAVLDDAWTAMLDLAVPLRFMDEPGYDEIFGTTEPRKPGSSWTIPGDHVVKFYSQYGVNQDRIKASAALKSANASGAAKLLTVEAKLQMNGITYGVPPGWKQTGDKYEWSMTTTISTDKTSLPAEQTVRRYQSVSGAAKGKNATEWSLQTAKVKYKYMP